METAFSYVGSYVVAALIASVGLVLALFAVWLSAHTWRHAPGRRLWMDLQLRIEDLEADNEALHERMRARASRENVTKATAVRVEKQAERRSIVDEAAAVLTGKQGTLPLAQPKALSEEQQLIALRRHIERMH